MPIANILFTDCKMQHADLPAEVVENHLQHQHGTGGAEDVEGLPGEQGEHDAGNGGR